MDYAVIMAGGTGKRLWPLSRRRRPKQVLRLFNGQTLLGACVDRLESVFAREHIWVLTNQAYADLVREELPGIAPGNIIAEPAVRDTAGAIGLAATILYKNDPDAIMCVVTADQVIEPASVLQQALQDAITFIKSNTSALVTFGIKPTCPSTQYGYIKCAAGDAVSGCTNAIYRVEEFKEKPNAPTARQYVEHGRYFWNSGMFVWRAGTILDLLRKHLPQSTEPLKEIGQAWGQSGQDAVLHEWFPKLPKISIDFAVMEKAGDVFAIRLESRWMDMGSFTSLTDMIKADARGNIVIGDSHELLDSENNIIVTEDNGHLMATIGLKDMIVVHSPDATFVCPIHEAAQLKELLDRIEDHGGEQFL
jgi:mannose-1-phosphate guanylyltransferase